MKTPCSKILQMFLHVLNDMITSAHEFTKQLRGELKHASTLKLLGSLMFIIHLYVIV